MLAESHRNKVFMKDILQVLKELPSDSLDMVYGDPDYNIGMSYNGNRYTKGWDEYIDWYGAIAAESMRVLKPTGNLFLLNYPKQNAYLRVRHLDALAYDVQDYVWIYNSNIGHSKRRFTRAHRSLLHATKSKENAFYKKQVAVPYQNPTDKRIQERVAAGHTGRMPYSWFYFDLVKNTSREKTAHPCQIPVALVKMLLLAATQEEDDIAILFGGSGADIELAR